MFGMKISFLPLGKSEAPLNYLNCSMACPMILVLHTLHRTLLHLPFVSCTGGLCTSLIEPNWEAGKESLGGVRHSLAKRFSSWATKGIHIQPPPQNRTTKGLYSQFTL